MPSDSPKPTVSPAPTRCVVWTPPGLAVPVRLQQSLAHHGLSVMQMDDVYGSVARVIAMHREGPGRGGIVFIPCYPQRLEQIGEALEMVSRYAPRAVCWWYDDAGGEQIRPVSAQDLSRWRPAPAPAPAATVAPEVVVRPRPAPSAPAQRPKLRLAGGPGDAELPPSKDEPSERTVTLSEDELAMLLGESADVRPVRPDEPRREVPR